VLNETFTFLFRQLKVENTMEIARKYVPLPPIAHASPADMRMKAAADDWDLSD
jgi:hypothetical protein